MKRNRFDQKVPLREPILVRLRRESPYAGLARRSVRRIRTKMLSEEPGDDTGDDQVAAAHY